MKTVVGTRMLGVGVALPRTIVTNADLEKLVDTSDEWITSRTGIKQRHIVGEGETCSSLAIAAAQDAIGFAGIDAGTIDLIIVATSTPDFLYPSTACYVQAAIGANNAAAFDLEAACTGIVYALTVAHQFIALGTYKTVLVVGADVHSKFLDWSDRNSCILFGDGAGAFVLQASDDDSNDILGCYLRSDGSGAHLLHIPNTGTPYPHLGQQVVDAGNKFFQMNGKTVYQFALKVVADAVRGASEKAGVELSDIDFLIPHQANQRIINASAEKLNFPLEKVICNIGSYGNTSAASIPLALHDALKSGQVQAPATCALVGFGGGLTWGAVIVRWTATDSRN